MKRKLIVVGNGMAGIRTVEELHALAPDAYDITVVSSEKCGAYNRIMLSPVLAGERKFDDIVTHPESWYAERGITLLAGFTVTGVRRQQREVLLDDGRVLHYDRLLLATGSVPFIVPLPGHQHPDVVGFRDIQDVSRMVAAAAHKKRVAVIGGGLLGLEAANGLLRQGMDVTVIHEAPCLLNRQLDAEAAGFLKESLLARGLKFRLGAQTAQIVHSEDGTRIDKLRFQDGSELPTDMVVMAVGIRPNVSLARKIGLQVDKAILVNDTLQTFDPCIYAVGECVQHRGALFGLVAPLFEQARVCANHLAGMGVSRFVQRATATTLKVSGVSLYSAGDFTDADAESLILRDPVGGVYKRLLIKNDRVIGSVLYGDTNDSSWYFDLIREQSDVASMRESLLFGRVEHEQVASF